ncbi:MAG: hypothetical protein ACPGVO_04460 [Spirulinaceae cyanobacterium]
MTHPVLSSLIAAHKAADTAVKQATDKFWAVERRAALTRSERQQRFIDLEQAHQQLELCHAHRDRIVQCIAECLIEMGHSFKPVANGISDINHDEPGLGTITVERIGTAWMLHFLPVMAGAAA